MKRNAWLLLGAVLAAGLLVTALLWRPPAEKSMVVTAQFEDTIGLYEGNAVSVLGMNVGKVISIAAKSSYVEVKFSIDNGVAIPADVKAVTVSTSILTDRHIELTPVYRGGPKLRNGDVLSLPRTRTPVEFDRTLAMIDKLSTSLAGRGRDQGPLGDLVGLGAKIATGSGKDLKATLDELSQALRLGNDNGAGTKKDIQAITASLAELTTAASDNDGAIREFGSNLHQLSDIVAQQNLGTGSTGAKINQILDQATALLENNRDRLKGTVTNMTTLTKAVDDHKRDLAEVFDILPLLAGNVYNMVDAPARVIRVHPMADKLLLNEQMAKEVCNLAGMKDRGCATGTLADYGPDMGWDFVVDGVTGMLNKMAGVP